MVVAYWHDGKAVYSVTLCSAICFIYFGKILLIMKIELDRKALETLVKGSQPYYNEFENPLVKKAGHSYSDQYGRTRWESLEYLTDEELYKLYEICKNSWS